MAALNDALIAFVDSSSCHRNEAEQFLLQFEKSPEAPIALISLFPTSQSNDVRNLIAVLLRRSIIKHWSSLQQQAKTTIQSTLLSLIVEHLPSFLRTSLADVIAVIGAATIPNNTWPDLQQFIISSLSSSVDHLQLTSLSVLNAILDRSGGSLRPAYPSISSLLCSLLGSESTDIVQLALSCFSHLFGWLDSSKQHKSLAKDIISRVLPMLKSRPDLEFKLLEVIEEVIQSPAKLLKKSEFIEIFVFINDVLQIACQSTANVAYTSRLVAILQFFVENRISAFGKSSKPHIHTSFKILAGLLTVKPFDVNHDDQNSLQSSAFTTLSSFADNLPLSVIVDVFLSECSSKMNGSENERIFAVTALGLLLTRLILGEDNSMEEIDYDELLINIFKLNFNFLQDSDEKVVCAALAAIAQMCESFQDLNESKTASVFIKFSTKILEKVVEIIQSCQSRQSHKSDLEWRSWVVVEHLVELDHMSQSFLSSTFELIGPRLLNHLVVGLQDPFALASSLELCFKRLELCFSVFSSFASTCPHMFSSKLGDYFNLIASCLSPAFMTNEVVLERGLEVCGRSIEFLGILISTMYSKVPESREYLLNISKDASELALLPLKSPEHSVLACYSIGFISQLIQAFGSQLFEFFFSVASPFFQSVLNSDDQSDDYLKQLKNSRVTSEFNKSQESFDLVDDNDIPSDSSSAPSPLSSFAAANEAIAVLSCLSSFAQFCREPLFQFVTKFVPLVAKVLVSPFAEVRVEAVKCLVNLTLCHVMISSKFTSDKRCWLPGVPVRVALSVDSDPLIVMTVTHLCDLITDDEDHSVVDCCLECLREALALLGPGCLITNQSNLIDMISRAVYLVFKGDSECQSATQIDSDDEDESGLDSTNQSF
ncbi:hypothetical protein GEMRC1_002939 [Eukaryota sp. GEM-RC1]